MSRICTICGKKSFRGHQITRRGMAKKQGGVGQKITGKTKRRFLPNLQRVRAVRDGRTVRIKVCTTCIRSGKIAKPA